MGELGAFMGKLLGVFALAVIYSVALAVTVDSGTDQAAMVADRG